MTNGRSRAQKRHAVSLSETRATALSRLKITLLSSLSLILGICCTIVFHPIKGVADQLDELLQSKQLRKFGNRDVTQGAKLRYKLRPWFAPDSNLERLFSDKAFAQNLIQWLMPTDPNYQLGATRTNFEKTHVHLDVIILDRKRKSMFQLTVLVPHPAFTTMIESDLIDDFAQRQPPRLKTTATSELVVRGKLGAKYSLRSERCSGLFKLAKGSWVELRSVEPCGTQNGLSILAEQLDLSLFEQKLQS